jgi:serine/threonine protein kinase
VGEFPARLGKYEVLSPLATGGMARIFVGRTTGIGAFERYVVLKIILAEKATDISSINMFLDEARLASSLNHQNVAQVFDVGQHDGIHFLAMEFVHGQDVRSVLATAGSSGRRIPYDLSLSVVAGAAAGLHHAHERRGADGKPLGIVHRDVSPSNIIVGYDGAVKMLDFGIAKATDRQAETMAGVIKGKFAYMSPEQCRGRDVDRRSDVFSLGIILYELTTQHRCFRADSDFDTMHRIVTGDITKPRELVPDYPTELEAIVMKALSVDSSVRYQTAAALLEAIERFAMTARMSASSMALGRFMREMFGEVPEPWLTQGESTTLMSAATLHYPRENTISNTNSAIAKATSHKLQSDAPLRLSNESSVDNDGVDEADINPYPVLSAQFTQPLPLLARNTALPLPLPASRDSGKISSTANALNAISTAQSWPPPGATLFGQTPPLQSHVPSQIVSLGVVNPPSTGQDREPSYESMGLHYPPRSADSQGSWGRDDSVAKDTPLYRRWWPWVSAAAMVSLILTIALSGPRSPTTTVEKVADEIKAAVAVPPIVGAPTVAPSAGSSITPVLTIEPTPNPLNSDRISVSVDSDPDGAEVLVDGLRIGITPFRGEVSKSNKSSILILRRVGFISSEHQFRATEPIVKRIVLKRPIPKVPVVKSPPPVAKRCVSAKDYNPITDGNRAICD